MTEGVVQEGAAARRLLRKSIESPDAEPEIFITLRWYILFTLHTPAFALYRQRVRIYFDIAIVDNVACIATVIN